MSELRGQFLSLLPRNETDGNIYLHRLLCPNTKADLV
jgi:hypothetical protein